MRLKPKRAPDPTDRRMTHANILRHRTGARVRPPTRGGLKRLGHNGLHRVVGDLACRAGARLVMQPVETLSNETRTPLADDASIAAQFTCDVLVRLPVSRAPQND